MIIVSSTSYTMKRIDENDTNKNSVNSSKKNCLIFKDIMKLCKIFTQSIKL